jgi:hypothetical protein
MIPQRFALYGLILIAFAALITPVEAQNAVCRQLRAELSALGSGGGGRARQFEAAAQRQRNEIARTYAYSRSIGCDRGQFLFFGSAPPPECGALQARIQRMQSNFDSLMRQAENMGGGIGSETRRQQLIAAIDQACNRPEPALRGEPLLRGDPGLQPPRGVPSGGLFNVPPPPPQDMEPEPRRPLNTDIMEEDEPAPRARGGSRPVCVRTCDGFFFPVNSLPNGRGGADDLCQALCPGVETKAYFMPGGDGNIEQAVSVDGEAYTQLANASLYKRKFEASCSCRGSGQSWLQALQNAEAMLDKRRGDIVVTQEKSNELARPRNADTKDISGKKKGAKNAEITPPPAAPVDTGAIESEAIAVLGASAPTAGTESAGIGPKSIEADPVLKQQDGAKQNVTTGDGTKRQVRIVAPDIVAPTIGRAP